MKSKNKNTTKRMETSATSTSSTSTKVSTTIDILKRFWKQNWHRILSAFAVLLVVCSIAFSCGVNAKALELTDDDFRFIDVSIRQFDLSGDVEVNYELSPSLYPDPDIYYVYPVVNWAYYQEGIVLDSSGLYSYTDAGAMSTVSHLVYVDEDGQNVPSSTTTIFELSEFSALPSVIANGQSVESYSVSDPYNYISFSCDAVCTADITLTIARREVDGTFTYKSVSYYDDMYYLTYYASFYNYLVSNITAGNFTTFTSGSPSVYTPSEREFISSVEILTYDGDFYVSGAATPRYATTEVYHDYYYGSSVNFVSIMALLGIGSGYQQGYIDGLNKGQTESLGIADWLLSAGDSVMNFQLFAVGETPITIGSIFTVITGSFLLIFLLKLFAGG